MERCPYVVFLKLPALLLGEELIQHRHGLLTLFDVLLLQWDPDMEKLTRGGGSLNEKQSAGADAGTCEVVGLDPRPSSSKYSSESSDKKISKKMTTCRNQERNKNTQKMNDKYYKIITCNGFRWRVELSVRNRVGVEHRSSVSVHCCLVSWGQRRKSVKEDVNFCWGVFALVTFLSPRSFSASWVRTLKSRNQVSNHATTNEVMGKT